MLKQLPGRSCWPSSTRGTRRNTKSACVKSRIRSCSCPNINWRREILMLNRRQFLEGTLKGSSLVALSTVVPNFITSTARAAPLGKDNILVVLEMTGGNDGVNTVVPYPDDHHQKGRPTLGLKKQEAGRIG